MIPYILGALFGLAIFIAGLYALIKPLCELACAVGAYGW